MALESPTANKKIGAEKLFLVLIVITVLIISNFPYWYAATHTPVAKEFTGLIGPYGNDTAFYLLWGPKQAADGEWLFEDKCNGFINRRDVLQPAWLTQGFLSGIIDIGVVPVYHMVRVACALIFYLLLWRFVGKYIREPLYRFAALLYCIIGSGFGFILSQPVSPDIWVIESNIFLTMLWEVNLPLANLLLLLASQAILDRAHARAVIPSLLLTSVYPYAVGNLLTLATVMAIYAYCTRTPQESTKISDTPSLAHERSQANSQKDKSKTGNAFGESVKTLMAVMVAVTPMTAYNAYLVLSRPDLVTGQDLYDSPALPLYALAFGIATPFVIIGAVVAYRRRTLTDYSLFPLVLWMSANLCIIYFPVPFRLQLILGTSIPVAILAAVGLRQFVTFLQEQFPTWHARKRVIENVIVSGFIVLALPTTVYHYWELFEQISEQRLPEFVDTELVKTMDWLKANTTSKEVVFSSAEISYLVPLYGHNRMFTCDYAAPTADYNERRAEVQRIITLPANDAISAWINFFREYRIGYLLVDETLKNEIGIEKADRFALMPNLREVFRSGDTLVYQVED